MILYLIIAGIVFGITVAGNMLLSYFDVINVNMYFPFFYGMLMVLALIAIDGICVSFVRFILPKGLFKPERKMFRVKKWEKNFLEKLGVKLYKDRIPELGALAGFRKDQIQDMSNPEYLYEFLCETCYAEVMHLISMFASFLVLIMCHDWPMLIVTLALPLAICNAALNILPINVQRYNRPRLEVLYKRALRNSKKQETTTE